MTAKDRDKQEPFKLWEKIVFFFPVQLLFVHLKKNILLLVFWLVLFGFVTKMVSLKYGIPYLFLFPEYLGEVNFLAHFIVGLVTGAFIMAFNISSYVVNGFRFPFLATLNRPFIKYSQNNVILPLAYSIVYCYCLIHFQYHFEDLGVVDIAFNLFGFITGNLAFIALTAAYFAATNKNARFYTPKMDEAPREYLNPVRDLFSNKKKWEPGLSRKEWKVITYISKSGRIALARNSQHYDQQTLEKVFYQNRINASLFQVVIILFLFVLGWFHEYEMLMIPAAASILLFFTMLIMLTSAFYSWFKGWTTVVFLVVLVSINFLTKQEQFAYENHAYGINYDTVKTPYNHASISEFQENMTNLYLDVENGLTMLQNWKERTGEEKPVAVFLNVPGGGLRSAMWTMHSVSQANQAVDGQLWQNLLMISGSSGGMIGGAYLREFYYRQAFEESTLPIDSAIMDIVKDKLNPVASTAVLNDMFFRFKTFEYEGHEYVQDRALAFERKLNRDTRGWLNKSLWDYHDLELSAKMPMLVLAPTISDDGRKLIISSQPATYLCHNSEPYQINENIEFSRFFEAQDAQNLNFISALRMSATFPYVFPAANLPTEPSIEILDAGIRDNYGMSNTVKYIFFFRKWLAANTSKIIIIQVRDQEKFIDLESTDRPSLWEEITQPFGTFYKTILDIQDYQMDDQLRLAQEWYEGDMEVVEFVLNRSEKNPISLSWHLTEKEKQRIWNASETDWNQQAFAVLKRLMEPE